MSTPLVSHGSKFGIHAIWPNRTIPMVRAARDRGVVIPMVKGVDNAGLAVEVKAIEPRTLTITRFVDRELDALQDIETWSTEKMRTVARFLVERALSRMNPQERAAADWLEIVNEADPPGVEGWRALGHFLSLLIEEANSRNVRLALPAFNAGTPEWDELVAFASTGVFAKMKQGGHILSLHEGVFGSDQPITHGFGDSIPGAPHVVGAGSLCFRYRYIYHLLEQRGEVVPCVISEFYAGGGYDLPVEQVIERMRWYDTGVRQNPYVLAVLPYTFDPNPGWKHANYNYIEQAFLGYLASEAGKPNHAPVPQPKPQPKTTCLVGLHGRADGRMQPPDFEAVQVSRMEAVKLLSSAAPEDVDRLRAIRPDVFVVVRLFADFRGRQVRPDDFVTWVAPDMQAFYSRGVRYFEVHNEPNITLEGWRSSWQNGREFSKWFIRVYTLLKAQFPEAQLGFPGLSPGGDIDNLRLNDRMFLAQADPAVQRADWLGVHCYWQSPAEMFNSEIGGLVYRRYHATHPGKPILITEFSNNSRRVSATDKGRQYVDYYRMLQKDTYVKAAFAYVVSASSGFEHEAWRNEAGVLNPIASIVGARSTSRRDPLIIDISKYQARFIGDPRSTSDQWNPAKWVVDIDFEALAAAVDGVIVRVGDGKRKDPCFDRFIAALEAHGIPYGIYHLYRPTEDAREQAQLVKQWHPRLPVLGMWGDYEVGTPTFAHANTYARELDMLYGTVSGVYSARWYFVQHFTLDEEVQWKHRPLWLAAPDVDEPLIPEGLAGRTPPYELHQNSWTARVPGIPRNVDTNRLYAGLSLFNLVNLFLNSETTAMGILNFTVLDNVTPELANAVKAHVEAMLQDVEQNGRCLPYGATAPEPAKTSLSHLTNQQVFNLFNAAFGRELYWNVLVRAVGNAHANNVMLPNRTILFTGPAVEDMSLSASERETLIRALATFAT